jgi:hypothetical protein
VQTLQQDWSLWRRLLHSNRKKKTKFKQQSTSAQYANDQGDDALEYVSTTLQNSESTSLQVSNYSLKSDFEDAWILYTGVAQHMTFQCDFFWTFQECQLNSIFLVDEKTHLMEKVQ